MIDKTYRDAIIIGGSYAGLSAAMALGRSLRRVLVIDAGKPCNRQTPHSHNFITHDGEIPKAIAEKAKTQVLAYPTVTFLNDFAIRAERTEEGFVLTTQSGGTFKAKKLLFATGITDELPPIPGLAECWGITALHCPYCHGYEVHHRALGVLGNGAVGFDLARLISQWTDKLTLFTDGPSTLTPEQAAALEKNGIAVLENKISQLSHSDGKLEAIVLADGSQKNIDALFVRPGFRQHCRIPQELGCILTEQGFIQVDEVQRTNEPGVYAAGDNSTPFRSVAAAVAAGTKAGAMLNRELIDESF